MLSAICALFWFVNWAALRQVKRGGVVALGALDKSAAIQTMIIGVISWITCAWGVICGIINRAIFLVVEPQNIYFGGVVEFLLYVRARRIVERDNPAWVK